MNIVFLGKYDESMRSLEENILNIQESSCSGTKHKLLIQNPECPDVIKNTIKNCDIWVISGNVKPTLLLKGLISEATIILFIFNFDNLQTLQFLTDGWGPIIKKVDQSDIKNQERILIGTQSKSFNYTEEVTGKIESAMKYLNCQKYFGEGEDLNLDKIGDYPITTNLMKYINDQISNNDIKSSINDENEEENKNNEESIENNENKIQIKFKNIIMNLFLTSKKAEIVSIQNLTGKINMPKDITYHGQQYIITNICDHAFQKSQIITLSFSEDSQLESIGNYVFEGSTIQTLFIPSKLKKLGKYWSAGAEKLSQILVDQSNPYFKSTNGFFVYENGSFLNILFAIRSYYDIFRINSVGYAFYKKNGLRNLINKTDAQVINIGDYILNGANNLQSIKFDVEKINIGDCSFSSANKLQTIEINSKSSIKIEKESFSNNNNLQTVSLIGNTIQLGKKCFYKSFYIYLNGRYDSNWVTIKSESKLEFDSNCFNESNLQTINIYGEEIIVKKESFYKCKFLKNFLISRSSILYFEESAFKDCPNLKLTFPDELSFVAFESNAICGCTNINEFVLRFGQSFDVNSYYEQIEIFKVGKTSNLLRLKKKGTDEIYMAKQLLKKVKYNTYISDFSKLLYMTLNSNISTFVGIGNIKFESESFLTIITKYFDNGSLEDVINNNIKLTITQKYIILLGLTYEMYFFHSKGYMYPNLTPEKILLDKNYYPHLNILGNLYESEQTIYTAPEVVIGRRNQKSDVYSFSLIVYQLITGIKLDDKDRNHFNIDVIVEKNFKSLIMKCYSYDIYYRPTFQQIFTEITNEQFIESFEANEEEIYQYMKLRIPEVTYNIELNNILYNISKYNKTAKIINIANKNTNFIFQEFITYKAKQYKIIEISYNAFSQSKFESFSIIENSKNLKIGDFTFETSDLNLTIPISIFRSCSNLKNIKIECSKLTTISSKGFYCSRINSLEITSDQIEIGDECFSSSYLKTLKIKSAKLSIGKYCFINCSSLSEISLGKLEQIKIDKNTFIGCNSLNKIYILAHCLEINDFSFNEANHLQSVELNSKEKLNICQNSFSNCFSVSTLVLKNEGDEELVISKNTFKDCKSLINITIDIKSTMNIGNETFSENNKLQTVSLRGNKIQLGDKCFYKSFDKKSNSVQIMSNTSVEIGQQCFGKSFIDSIEIKSKEVHIKTESFLESQYLKKFSASDSTEVFIDEFSFKDCTNLSSISLNEIGYLKIGSNAFIGCENIQNFELKFSKPFVSSKYYQSKGLFKKYSKFKTYRIYLFKKKGQLGDYYAKIFKIKEKYTEYLNLFINQMIPLLKENNPILSNIFECGYFIFSKKPYLTTVINCAKGSLDDLIEANELLGEPKYLILLGIAACMKYLHSKNIYHLDLTSRMIMIDESYHPHLNISELINTSEPTIYTAPEILLKKPISNKSDVYSFSLIAYELITGQQPNQANLSNDKILNNKQISDFLKQCWSQNISERPTFEEIFDEILKDQYLTYFKAKKERIDEYLSLISEFAFKKLLVNLNEYEKIEKIGSGTFSEVFMIKNNKTNMIYAAKISKESLDEYNKSILRNLQREINIISKLIHPTIIKFIGFSPTNFSNEDKPVIITEYMQNGTLQDIIILERKSQSPKTWNDTKKLINIYGIAFAMSYLHSHGIIHRDLKPSNILMDEYLIPKIGDFGLSKFLQTNGEENCMSNSSTGGIKGTILYTAPEIIEENKYSLASDVYSFGLIVYEIITNNPPFDSITNSFQIQKKVTKGIRPNFKFQIPKSYQSLIERCWSQDPFERPTFDQILKELKCNSEFIIESVDPDDYHDFISYLEECEKTYKTNNPFIPINLFIKRKTETFSPININEQIERDGIQYCISNDQTAKIIQGCEMNGKFKFPEYLFYNDDQYNIIEICDEAFSKSIAKMTDKSCLVTISIPYKKIGNKCFEKVGNIKEVTFQSSDLIIGEKCFYECKSLQLISFPNAQNLILSSQSFKECKKLHTISISKAQKIEIGEECFSNLKQISNISFKCRDLRVGSNCFASCETLKSFSCVVSKISFGSQPFDKCLKLEKFSINYVPIWMIESSNENQNDDIIFNDNFFNYCSSLNCIEIDTAQPIVISANAFIGCNSLKIIKLKSLSTITLTKNVQTNIEIQQLEVSGKRVKIDNYFFYSSLNLISLQIESDEIDIGNYCLSYCSNLMKVLLNKSTKVKFGSYSFSNCLKLSSFVLNSYGGPAIKELEIGDYCFSNCKILPIIYFWKVQNAKIGSNAFEKCEQIKEFNMFVSSKLEIGNYCFLKSSNLKEVYMTGKYLTTGSYLFDKCYSISSIYIRGTISQNIDSNAFLGLKRNVIK